MFFHLRSNVSELNADIGMAYSIRARPASAEPHAKVGIWLQGSEVAALRITSVPSAGAAHMANAIAMDSDAMILLSATYVELLRDTPSLYVKRRGAHHDNIRGLRDHRDLRNHRDLSNFMGASGAAWGRRDLRGLSNFRGLRGRMGPQGPQGP